jgi:hypothetical protein
MVTRLRLGEVKRQLKESGEWDAVQNLLEELHSPEAKVFMYTPRGHSTAHPYQETASGVRVPLCAM